MKLVVKLALEILAMQRDIEALTAEVDRLDGYEAKYNDLVMESIKSGEQLMAGMFQVGLEMARMQGQLREPYDGLTL